MFEEFLEHPTAPKLLDSVECSPHKRLRRRSPLLLGRSCTIFSMGSESVQASSSDKVGTFSNDLSPLSHAPALEHCQDDPLQCSKRRDIFAQFQEDGLTDHDGAHYSVCELQGAVIQALRDDGCLVAIKFLKGRNDSPEAISKQLDLLSSLTKLHHPHLVEVLGFGEVYGQVFTVMEFMGAGSLRDILLKAGLLKPRQAAAYISDLLAGLDYLHSLGVVHGNVKPDNVLLTPEGRCKLSDFGLMQGGSAMDGSPALPSPMQLALMCRRHNHSAAFFDALKSAGTTTQYSAPEVEGKASLTHGADIWSVGLLTLELVTGKGERRDSRMRQPVSLSNMPTCIPWGQLGSRVETHSNPSPTGHCDIPDNLPLQLQDFLKACLSPLDARPTAQVLRNHEFITRWRPAIFKEESQEDIQEPVSSSMMLDRGDGGLVDKLVAVAACSDLMKAIGSIITYQENDFVCNVEACIEMVDIARNLQAYVAHVVQYPAMATKLHATLLDATKLLMQSTKGWQRLDPQELKENTLRCCQTLAVFMDCKGRWGRRIHLDDEAHQLQKKGDFAAAEEVYLAAQAPDPFNTAPIFELARLEHFIRRDLEKAQELYSTVLQLEPCHVQSLVGLGIITAEDDAVEAQQYFQKAIELGGDHPDSVALAYMGDIQKKKGEVCFKVSKVHVTRREEAQAKEYQEKSSQLYGEALDWYTRAVAQDPCNSWALGQMAHIHLLQHRHQAAEEKFRQAVAVDPSNGFALSGLGWSYIHKKLYTRAQHCFSDALLFCPTDSWATCGMGAVLLDLHHRPQAAEHYFRQSVEYDATNDWALVYLATIALRCRKRPEEAQRLCMTALAHNPANAWAIALLADATAL
eukprot:GGOE01001489.1.p1 GENE.GGOE01001489.1~~GGOE01001489.1.p1  ORF type:complete len:868 (-),score=261.33 GGOE01001489.1:437-3010(-)